MDELPPLPWKVDDTGPDADYVHIRDAIGRSLDVVVSDGAAAHIVRCVNATADPDILALAEHLAAMDQGQRGAAMDQIKHAIGGEW